MIGSIVTLVVFTLFLGSFWISFMKDPKRIEELIDSIGGKEHEIISSTFFHPKYQSASNGHWLVRTYCVRYIDETDQVHYAHMNTDLYKPLRIVDDKIVDAEKGYDVKYEFEKEGFSWSKLLGSKK